MHGSLHVLRPSLMYWPLQPGGFARWRTSPSGVHGTIKVETTNVGMVGWSGGGNRAVLTMARYGDRFPGLKWYASWESPVLGSRHRNGNISSATPTTIPPLGLWISTACVTAPKCRCGYGRFRDSR